MSRWPSRRCSTTSSATRAWRPPRSWSTWWPRAASAARRGADSANMPGADAGAGWGGLLGPPGGPPPQARSPARMQYVHTMSQSAKSSRVSATPDVPESAAGTRAAAQRLKMRRELAAAAMELFATKGYEATTVDEIARAAGVARRTFFRHFRSKEEAIFPDHDDTLVRAEAVRSEERRVGKAC